MYALTFIGCLCCVCVGVWIIFSENWSCWGFFMWKLKKLVQIVKFF
jgi:hypothetical protein